MGGHYSMPIDSQILGQHHTGATHPVNGAMDLMRAGQGVRHGNRLESQFVISNVEERALGCKVEVPKWRTSERSKPKCGRIKPK